MGGRIRLLTDWTLFALPECRTLVVGDVIVDVAPIEVRLLRQQTGDMFLFEFRNNYDTAPKYGLGWWVQGYWTFGQGL